MRVVGALTQVNRLLGRACAKPRIALRFVGSVIHRFFPSLVVLPVNGPVFTLVQLVVVGAPVSGLLSTGSSMRSGREVAAQAMPRVRGGRASVIGGGGG